MRDILVFAIVMLSLPTCFRRPFVGLLVFSWLAYMRPQDLCWGFARSMRLSFLVAMAMLVGWWAVERGRRRFASWGDLRTRCLVALGLFVAISYAFAEVHDDYTNTYFFEFVKILVIALFTTGQIDTKERFKILVWTIAICLAFFGVKGGFFGILTGGATKIIRGPGGMMEDNNDFALALTMNIPLLWYLGLAERDRPWIAKVTKIAILLTVVTIVLTHSRGGFLALTAAVLWIAWRSGKILRAFGALALLALLFPIFAPQSVLDRLASIGDTTESSASARLQSWSTALNMIEDNFFLGVGLRNFQGHYAEYADYTVTGRIPVAHNSYLQIWAESGSIAFFIYVALLVSVFITCRHLYRLGRSRSDMQWVADYARMMEATTVGFLVGAVFLNRGHFDLIYHWMALVTGLAAVSYAAYRNEPTLSTTKQSRKSGRSISVRWRDSPNQLGTTDAGLLQATPTWRRRT